jgi:zinc protease
MRSPRDPLRIAYAEGPNGLRVAVQPPPPGAGSFSATYVGPGGWAFDPAGSRGLARMTARLLSSGAGRRDRVELARYLDRAGGTLSAHCDPESAEATVWGPVESAGPLLGVLADAVLRPRFAAADLDRVRRQVFEQQLREEAQPGPRADRELHRALFPEGHPYRESGLGDRRSVSGIGREDLRRFHARQYTGGDGLLALTIARPLDSIVRTVRHLFADLPSEVPPAPRLPPVGKPPRASIEIDLPGRSQVEVRVGGPSIRRSDPSYPAAYLADEVLGGATLLSRLFHHVRSKAGLAYHATSQLEAMRWGGYWVAEAGTGAERWRRVAPMLRREVERISSEPVPAAELELVRESRLGEVALALESTADAHELALDVAYHRLPEDHWVTWPSVLRGLRPEEVQRAAAVAFDRSAAVTVIVGPLRPVG